MGRTPCAGHHTGLLPVLQAVAGGGPPQAYVPVVPSSGTPCLWSFRWWLLLLGPSCRASCSERPPSDLLTSKSLGRFTGFIFPIASITLNMIYFCVHLFLFCLLPLAGALLCSPLHPQCLGMLLNEWMDKWRCEWMNEMFWAIFATEIAQWSEAFYSIRLKESPL